MTHVERAQERGREVEVAGEPLSSDPASPLILLPASRRRLKSGYTGLYVETEHGMVLGAAIFVKQQSAGLSEACGETRAVFLLRNKIRIQDSDAGLRSRLVWRQREHQAAVGTVKPNMTTSGAETVKEEKRNRTVKVERHGPLSNPRP